MKDFRITIKEHRNKTGLTLDEFSEAIGANNKSSYKPIEYLTRPIGMKFFKRFSSYFKRICDHEMFLGLLEHCGVDLRFLADAVETSQWHRPPTLPNHHDIVWVALAGENFPQVAHFLKNESGRYFLYKGLRLSVEEVEMWRYREILPSERGRDGAPQGIGTINKAVSNE